MFSKYLWNIISMIAWPDPKIKASALIGQKGVFFKGLIRCAEETTSNAELRGPEHVCKNVAICQEERFDPLSAESMLVARYKVFLDLNPNFSYNFSIIGSYLSFSKK